MKRSNAGKPGKPDYILELFMGLRTQAGWWSRVYILLQILRRIIFIGVAIYVYKSPWIQAMSFIIISEISLIYLI